MAEVLKKEVNDTDVLCQEVLGMPVMASAEQVTVDATVGGNQNTSAFTLGRLYSFCSTVDAFIAFGPTATVTIAANTGYFLPAGVEKIFIARQTHCAVIRSVVSGVLLINLHDGGAN
jgi:hypothetical protein